MWSKRAILAAGAAVIAAALLLLSMRGGGPVGGPSRSERGEEEAPHETSLPEAGPAVDAIDADPEAAGSNLDIR